MVQKTLMILEGSIAIDGSSKSYSNTRFNLDSHTHVYIYIFKLMVAGSKVIYIDKLLPSLVTKITNQTFLFLSM